MEYKKSSIKSSSTVLTLQELEFLQQSPGAVSSNCRRQKLKELMVMLHKAQMQQDQLLYKQNELISQLANKQQQLRLAIHGHGTRLSADCEQDLPDEHNCNPYSKGRESYCQSKTTTNTPQMCSAFNSSHQLSPTKTVYNFRTAYFRSTSPIQSSYRTEKVKLQKTTYPLIRDERGSERPGCLTNVNQAFKTIDDIWNERQSSWRGTVR